MRQLVSLLVLSAAASALASQPEQPIDCSDWVSNEPGHTRVPFAAYPCDSAFCVGFDPTSRDEDRPGSTRVVANDGAIYMLRRSDTGVRCGWAPGWKVLRTALVRFNESGEFVVGYFEDRCLGGNSMPDSLLPQVHPDYSQTDWNEPNPGRLLFDDKNGRLLLFLRPFSNRYRSAPWIAAIAGFATTFEVLQTYAPPSAGLGFRTPYMPEGMLAADHFDTYWGAITQPLDLANAHPLQCAYPPSPPSVGDYLQITAPVPTPSPGHANYVLTAVTHQGHTRAGRRASGGRLTGRDAAQLPACVPPPTQPKRG